MEMSFLINSNATSTHKFTDSRTKEFKVDINGDGVQDILTFNPRNSSLKLKVSKPGGGFLKQDISKIVNTDSR